MHSSYAAIDIVAGGKRAQNDPIETKYLKPNRSKRNSFFNKTSPTKGKDHEQYL
jgi:hypothetical protein